MAYEATKVAELGTGETAMGEEEAEPVKGEHLEVAIGRQQKVKLSTGLLGATEMTPHASAPHTT